jgi:hypothetical protein
MVLVACGKSNNTTFTKPNVKTKRAEPVNLNGPSVKILVKTNQIDSSGRAQIFELKLDKFLKHSNGMLIGQLSKEGSLSFKLELFDLKDTRFNVELVFENLPKKLNYLLFPNGRNFDLKDYRECDEKLCFGRLLLSEKPDLIKNMKWLTRVSKFVFSPFHEVLTSNKRELTDDEFPFREQHNIDLSSRNLTQSYLLLKVRQIHKQRKNIELVSDMYLKNQIEPVQCRYMMDTLEVGPWNKINVKKVKKEVQLFNSDIRVSLRSIDKKYLKYSSSGNSIAVNLSSFSPMVVGGSSELSVAMKQELGRSFRSRLVRLIDCPLWSSPDASNRPKTIGSEKLTPLIGRQLSMKILSL